MSDREHELDDDLVEENSLLEMSDEEIMNLDPSTLAAAPQEAEQ